MGIQPRAISDAFRTIYGCPRGRTHHPPVIVAVRGCSSISEWFVPLRIVATPQFDVGLPN